MKTKIVVAAGLAGCALAWAAKDPVIMTINGVDVPKSEFEYLYKKNGQQQIGDQTIDEYADMFTIYKLKVADALAEGIDTTKAFRDEFSGYRTELAAPYMVDSLYIRQLEREAYDRAGEEVEVSHIMLYKTRDAVRNAELQVRLDSIRSMILSGADFSEMASNFSEDRGAKINGGNLGFITSLNYPYKFETTAYSLAPGEISGIVESPVAYHILKGGARRPARGKVLVEHILKLVPQDANDSVQNVVRIQIDSIYSQAKPENFSALAQLVSDDKNSARQGGKLPWFGTGQMVREFDEMAFSMNLGEVSKPFRTQYGWHIIHKLDAKPLASYEEMEPEILERVTHKQDERSKLIKKHQVEKLEKEYKGMRNEAIISEMRNAIAVAGIDSVFVSNYTTSRLSYQPIYTYGDSRSITAGQLVAKLHVVRMPNTETAQAYFDECLEKIIQSELFAYEETQLPRKYSEFRNLVNEYRDGMLLFEVSNRKVWDKATKDTEGLARYFETHRSDYVWKEPHVKGILVQTVNDSIASEIKARMAQLAPDTLVRTIRKEFPKQVQIDRVLVARGANAMVDNIAFGGPEARPSNSKFAVYFLSDYKVLDEPEDVTDVRGMVTNDYQNQLESAWIRELKEKYPVAISRKELKKINKDRKIK